MQSQGEVSRRDLSAAFRQLNVPAHDADRSDDERILNLFQVRQSDSGPSAQEENRQALYKIGMHRGSRMLINASRQTMETYSDALTWLGHGANISTTDDALLAIAGAKVSSASSGICFAAKADTFLGCRQQRQRGNGAEGHFHHRERAQI